MAKVKAVTSFAGVVTMGAGEVREIADEEIVSDLLRAGYITVEDEEKTMPESEEMETPESEEMETPEGEEMETPVKSPSKKTAKGRMKNEDQ